jgi:aryl-alcohol dehydrogenase-like predicted oxidoreductase
MSTDSVPKRPLGQTGEQVSMLGLGGAHIGRLGERAAVHLVRRAVDLGVTFMDNAWEYGRGRAEELMGLALADGYRDRVFLMTKHHGRDRATARQHLDDSMRRLRTDVIDLWQFHEVIYDDDPDRIFARGGGIEAALEAREAGKIRYIGFTGHKDPRIHLEMLARGFAWDSVQMPLSVLDAHYRSFEREVLPVLVEQGIGVIAMKTMADGRVLSSGAATPRDALSYVWSLPVSTIVSGMESVRFLEENVAAARAWSPPSAEARGGILARSRAAALGGENEPFKSDNAYDGSYGRMLHGLP